MSFKQINNIYKHHNLRLIHPENKLFNLKLIRFIFKNYHSTELKDKPYYLPTIKK